MQLHLRSRYFDPKLYSGLTITEDTCTFILWNLAGKLVGYQTYTPSLAQYYTHTTKPTVGGASELAVWGLETVAWNSKFLFLTNEVFDAARLHWNGLPAIAVLEGDSMQLSEWLYTLPSIIISCVQKNRAGENLAKYGQQVIHLPAGDDIGSLNRAVFTDLFKTYLDGNNKN